MARFDIEVHAEFPSRVVISMCEVVGGVVIDHDLVATLQIEKKKDFFWHICLWLAKISRYMEECTIVVHCDQLQYVGQ